MICLKTLIIHQTHQKRLRLILARLESIHKPDDMNLPGFDFHKLGGDRKAEYAVSVNKNWRIIFNGNCYGPNIGR